MTRYYTGLAAAFVRGSLPEAAGLDGEAAIESGLAAGLRIHKFKVTSLERVLRTIGILRSFAPASLLDIGSGRGSFLWPLLDSFPGLPVTAADIDERRCRDLAAVRRGGVDNLSVIRMDAQRMAAASGSVDVVTMLETMEHMPSPEQAAAEAVRVARRAVIFSVPSHEDDNPEHIHLFTRPALEAMFRKCGARQIRFTPVLNHFLGVAMVE